MTAPAADVQRQRRDPGEELSAVEVCRRGLLRDLRLGVQATVRSPGTIRLGDTAHLL